jgi:hypothetical protein
MLAFPAFSIPRGGVQASIHNCREGSSFQEKKIIIAGKGD